MGRSKDTPPFPSSNRSAEASLKRSPFVIFQLASGPSCGPL